MRTDQNKSLLSLVVILSLALITSIILSFKRPHDDCQNFPGLYKENLDKYVIIDTIQFYPDNSPYQMTVRNNQDTFSITIFKNGTIETIVPIVKGNHFGFARIYTPDGELKYITVSSPDSIVGFRLEFSNNLLVGYSERSSHNCFAGKSYGFNSTGRFNLSSYQDCDGNNSIITTYEEGVTYTRSHTIEGQMNSVFVGSDKTIGLPKIYNSRIKVWPDTSWLNTE